MISKRSDRSGGFTLIEVMVALAIVGLSLGAVAASVSQMVDAATTMRERTYGSWIGQNKIAELRLANVVPEVSDTSGELEYAGIEWAWRANISETGVENLFRVDVTVSYPGSDHLDPYRQRLYWRTWYTGAKQSRLAQKRPGSW